jgi:hypothetical protein
MSVKHFPPGMRYAVCFHDPASGKETDARVKYFPDAESARAMAAEFNAMLRARRPVAPRPGIRGTEVYYVWPLTTTSLPWLIIGRGEDEQPRTRRKPCRKVASVETADAAPRSRKRSCVAHA